MPHIVIEYSASLSSAARFVMQEAHNHMTQCGLCDPQAVKARAIPYHKERLPEGAHNFMHITVSLLEGRSIEERKSLSQAMFDLAKAAAPQADRLSVDIREMVSATYSK